MKSNTTILTPVSRMLIALFLLIGLFFMAVDTFAQQCMDINVAYRVTSTRPQFVDSSGLICDPQRDRNRSCYLRGYTLNFTDSQGQRRSQWSSTRKSTVQVIERQCFYK